MKYWGPINSLGGINGNDPYLNGDPIAGTHGSIPTFQIFEQTLRELTNLVIKSGLTPDAIIDGIQVAQAVQSSRMLYAVDIGTADAMAITVDPVPAGYSLGMRFLVKKGNTANATTTPTINVSGRGIVAIRDRDGQALTVGALAAGALLDLAHDGTNFRATDLIAPYSYVSRMQVFTSSGTFTVPPGITSVQVEVIGSGGGGGATGNGAGGGIAGNAGSGGGGGGYCRKSIGGLTPGAQIAVTVGVRGISAINDGSTAGTGSSFGSYCTAGGGGRGIWGYYTDAWGGQGGSAVGGDLNILGSTGGFCGPNLSLISQYTPSYVQRLYYMGGASGGGMSNIMFNGSGGTGMGYGGGGYGGTGGNNLAGGEGANGAVIVRW